MASYDLKAILGEKIRRLTDKTLKALVDCMCTVGASLCSLDKRISALESVELPEGGYKPMQEPVASPSASGTAVQFIESVSQDATGRMTATKKTVRSASRSQSGVMSVAHYLKLEGIESGAKANVQSDWGQSDDSMDDYIKNKPNLADVAFSGDYSDLENLPDLTKKADLITLDFSSKPSTFSWNDVTEPGIYNVTNSPSTGPYTGTCIAIVTNNGGLVVQLVSDGLSWKTRSGVVGTTWSQSWRGIAELSYGSTFVNGNFLSYGSGRISDSGLSSSSFVSSSRERMHVEAYFGYNPENHTYYNVGLYQYDSLEPKFLPTNITYGERTYLDGDLSDILLSSAAAVTWNPLSRGCEDFSLIWNSPSNTTRDFPLKRVASNPTCRRFVLRVVNIGSYDLTLRFCYERSDTHSNLFSIFNNSTDTSTSDYLGVTVRPGRVVSVDIEMLSSIEASMSGGVFALATIY